MFSAAMERLKSLYKKSIIYQAVLSVKERDFLSPSLIVLLCALVCLLIGYGWEALLLVVIFRAELLLTERLTDMVRSAAIIRVGGHSEDIKANLREIFREEDSEYLAVESELEASVFPVFLLGICLALAFIFFGPALKSLSFKASIHRALSMIILCTPFSMTASFRAVAGAGLCHSASNGIIFNKASSLEALADCTDVVIDPSVFEEGSRQLLSFKSNRLDNDTLINFAFHLCYQSQQSFARALVESTYLYYQEDLIRDFKDIPGYGIIASVNGTRVMFANPELAEKFKVEIEDGEQTLRGETYYLCIGRAVAGSFVFSNENPADIKEILRSMEPFGISCELFEEKPAAPSHRKKLILSIFNRENAEKLSGEINLLVDYSAADYDGCILPDSLSSICKIPYLSRRVNELCLRNGFFAFGVKVLLICLSILGFCTPLSALITDFAVCCVCILNANRIRGARLFGSHNIDLTNLNIPFLRRKVQSDDN